MADRMPGLLEGAFYRLLGYLNRVSLVILDRSAALETVWLLFLMGFVLCSCATC
jgi:hypothetical protein